MQLIEMQYVLLLSINEGTFYGENQFGFKQGISCAHAHMVLANVPCKASQQNKQAHFCLLDISNVVDSIVHSQALYSLTVNGLNISIVFVLRYWYNYAHLHLKLKGTLMQENTTVYCCVHQGRVLP